ncbi:unnamed protein product [Thelazia callipaeda]|uniref:tryptophan--tRNA ligase n=1 Tax=Thelazia callipaeda TaxID=103827 RepID=A0A0N5D0A0_THECL|nr:unnamed protein product [Thelazia callipaeda]
MKTTTAQLSQILLAERRDKKEIEFIAKELSQIFKDLFGPQLWISYSGYFPIVAQVAYYVVTTLLGIQTVGEEYVSIVPLVLTKDYKIPSFTCRLVFVLIHAVVPFLTEKLFGKIEQNLDKLLVSGEAQLARRHKKLRGIPVLFRLNKALFYIYGTYYHISRRLVGWQYISLCPQLNNEAFTYFRLLGAIIVAQIILDATIWIKKEWKNITWKEARTNTCQPSSLEISRKDNSLLTSSSFCCLICSQYNKPPVCTPCGHLFCWDCILKHIQYTSLQRNSSSFCPHCRQQFHRSRIQEMSIVRTVVRNLPKRLSEKQQGFRYLSISKKLEKADFSLIYVSGIQPTGIPHLGNYFGFIQHWIDLQNVVSRNFLISSSIHNEHSKHMYLSIADYHSISTGFVTPNTMKNNLLQMAASLLACGVDPQKTVLFQQSTVADHVNLMYVLGSLQTLARLTRMPQYKDKAAAFKRGDIPINLQLYPVLQAADVLLYKGTHVPVGDDQTQHLLLMRDLATKFNAVLHYDFFPIPVQMNAKCSRLKSLNDATKKMSKSVGNDRSRILITDSRQVISNKCAKALSDFVSHITYEPEKRPAVSNLVTLYALSTGKSVHEVVDECSDLDTKGFKSALAEKIDMHIAPVREKYETLIQKPQVIHDVLMFGTQRAEKKARETMRELRELLGFNVFEQKIDSRLATSLCGRKKDAATSSYIGHLSTKATGDKEAEYALKQLRAESWIPKIFYSNK